MGVVLAVVFGAANAYLGLKVGMTVSASIPAAVVSMGVLRLLFRRGSVLESNLSQTIGSAGESVAAGAVFTLPALFLWAGEGRCALPDAWMVSLVSLVGGLLGVFFMIPIRKALIAGGRENLPFPEGTACADVLHAGDGGGKGARAGIAGFGAGAMLTPALSFLHVPLSPALLGVGWIVGPRIGALMVSGSALARFALVPIAAHVCSCDLSTAWSAHVKFVAVGAIATAGFISLFRSLPTLLESMAHRKGRDNGNLPEAEHRDLPPLVVWGGVLVLVVTAALVTQIPVGFVGASLIAVLGFFFATVAARICGLIGSSNSPVAGMTIATLLFAVPFLRLLPGGEGAFLAGTITVGSVICLICSIAGDTAQDLKTGALVGATPRVQQLGEVVGVVASSLAIGLVIKLMHAAWGFGSEAAPAPQAMLMKSIVECAYGGALPWGHLAIGAGLSLVALALRVPVMAFALGTYLPFGTMLTVFVGGLIRTAALRKAADRTAREKAGTLLSAGVIAGEGLAGIALALIAVCC